MKKQLIRLTGDLLAATFFVSSMGLGVLAADKPTMEKNETVYVIAGADGTANDVIVSDWLKNGGAKDILQDNSDLKDITVVKGDAELSGSGSGMSWTTGGEDVYYQGTSQQELPVGVKFTYTLDGKTVTPEELAGKSGKLTITIEYTNTEKRTVDVNGKSETMYVPFLMTTGLLMSSDTVKNVEVDHGMVENDGDHTIILGYGLPGLGESLKLDEMAEAQNSKKDPGDKTIEAPEMPSTVTITADVTDFSLDMTVTLATSSVLDTLDLDGSETRQQLEDALLGAGRDDA